MQINSVIPKESSVREYMLVYIHSILFRMCFLQFGKPRIGWEDKNQMYFTETG
jgi:hypothetical protein